MHAHIHTFFLSLLMTMNVSGACDLDVIPAMIDCSLELLVRINPFSLRLFLLGYFITATERKTVSYQKSPDGLTGSTSAPTPHLRCHATPASFPAWGLLDFLPSEHPLHVWCPSSLGTETLSPAQSPYPGVGPCSHTSQHCALLLLVRVSPRICLIRDQRCTRVHGPACPTQGPEPNPAHLPRGLPSRCS